VRAHPVVKQLLCAGSWMIFEIILALVAGVSLTWVASYISLGLLSQPHIVTSNPAILSILSKFLFFPHPLIATPISFVNQLVASMWAMRKRKKDAKYIPRREIVKTSDGGQFALDWFDAPPLSTPTAADAPIIFCVHGVNGGRSVEFS